MKKSQIQNGANTLEIKVAEFDKPRAANNDPVGWEDIYGKMMLIRDKIDDLIELVGATAAEDDLYADQITDRDRQVLAGIQEALFQAHDRVYNATPREEDGRYLPPNI
jgi:hypothetical protein